MKDDYLLRLIEGWKGTLYTKGASKEELKPKEEWHDKWPQIYQTCPNAALLEARGQVVPRSAYQVSESKVYFAAWEVWFPDLLVRKYKKAMPPCPSCEKADHVNCNGWQRAPRRVVELDRFAYIYSRKYRCRKGKSGGCGRESILHNKLGHGLASPLHHMRVGHWSGIRVVHTALQSEHGMEHRLQLAS